MITRSPRCYKHVPSFLEIGKLVPKKKIFERILPYMGMAAILVMWPRCREQIFVPPIQGGSTYNQALICSAVVNDADGRTDAGQWVFCKLIYEPSAQVSQ